MKQSMRSKTKSMHPLNNDLTSSKLTLAERKVRQDLLQQVIENVSMMYRFMGSSRDHFLASHGISKPQLELLTILSDESLSIKVLASKLHVTSSAVTQIVSNLTVQGLLQRTTNSTDHRSIIVGLSSDGKARFRKIKQEYIERIEEMLANVDQSLLIDLQRITKQITEEIGAK